MAEVVVVQDLALRRWEDEAEVVRLAGEQLAPDDADGRAREVDAILVQRLEIARLLAPGRGSAPLLLDDPFAHYDSKRLRFGLQLLREAANERQLIVFSEDENLPALASAVCGDCNLIELPAPEARLPQHAAADDADG